MPLPDQGEDRIYLDDPDAVGGILPVVRGGTGNQRGHGTGLTLMGFVQDASVLTEGTVVVCSTDGTWVRTTSVNSIQPVGIIVTPNEQAYSMARIQYQGVCEVTLTGSATPGDRLGTSSTIGTAAVLSSASNPGFAKVISQSGSGKVWAILDGGGHFPFTLVDHGGLSGSSNSHDHPEYVPRFELRRGRDKIRGITPTASGMGGVSNAANITDGSDATGASIGAFVTGGPGFHAITLTWDLTRPTTLSMVRILHNDSGWGQWVVQYSDDNVTYYQLDTDRIQYEGDRSQAHAATSARYWRLLIGDTYDGFQFKGGWTLYSVEWYEQDVDTHTIWGDSHRDAGTHLSLTSNQVLAWSSNHWIPRNVVNQISSNGSNFLSNTVNLQAGSGIHLGVSGQTITIFNTGQDGGEGGGGGTPLTIEDDTTSVANVETIVFEGATVTDDGGGQVTVEVEGIDTTLIGCRVYNSSSQTATDPFLTYNTESFDTDGFHSTSADTDRLTVPSHLGGTYLLIAHGLASARARLEPYVNGALHDGIAYYPPSETSGWLHISTVLNLNGGDYVQIKANRGGSATYGSSTAGDRMVASLIKLSSTRGGLGEGIGAKVYRTTNQTVTAATETTVLFDNEEFDTHGFHESVTNPGRLTIPAGVAPGYFYIRGYLGLPSLGANAAYLELRKNGTTYLTGTDDTPGNGVNPHIATIVYLTQGDYVEMRGYRATGTTFGGTTAVTACTFEIMRIDSGSTGDGALPTTRARRTSGSLTLNSTSWANVDTGLDLTVAAQVGDWLEVSLSGFFGQENLNCGLDGVTLVSGSPVNYISGSAGGASAYGVQSWLGADGTQAMPVGGAILYQVVSGDLSGGNVTLRLRYRTSSASNKTLAANTNQPLEWSVVNLRSRGVVSDGSRELDYVQITTATTNITATAEASATTIVTGNAVTYDGATTILVEFSAPQAYVSAVAGRALTCYLYDGSGSIGRFIVRVNPASGDNYDSLYGAIRLTPSAGSHTYSIRAIESAGAGVVYAGAGGSGNLMPAYIRITRV